MYRLLEITYTDKESVALYPADGQEPFANETALTAEFDTKMGAAMKADAYKAELLVAFDGSGNIIAQGYSSKDENVSLNPRLIWVQTTEQGEVANQSKENDLNTLMADMYTKRGSAKKNTDVKSIALIGIDGKSVAFHDFWSRPGEPVAKVEAEA